MLNSVVLPAPLGPIRDTIPYLGTSNDTSETAVRPPNSLVTWSAWSAISVTAPSSSRGLADDAADVMAKPNSWRSPTHGAAQLMAKPNSWRGPAHDAAQLMTPARFPARPAARPPRRSRPSARVFVDARGTSPGDAAPSPGPAGSRRSRMTAG